MTKTELLKISKPILFNTEMVKAILDGRKTVTRRVVNPQIETFGKAFAYKGALCSMDWVTEQSQYKIGDILYVRETFNNIETTSVLYAADKEFIDFGCKEVDGYMFMESEIKWHPSIHMPKSAARIFLRITDVRVERLQDITEEQAIKEGIQGYSKDNQLYKYAVSADWWEREHAKQNNNFRGTWWQDMPRSSIVALSYLWNSTIKKQDLDKYGWNANPWVWVYEFERVNVDE